VITISTTTSDEARAVTELMSQASPELRYAVYLLGREVAPAPADH
jgi:hypothetical protein